MDLSALIFVAVAVAWAVYLVPKALAHTDAGDRIEAFSSSTRVLARREPTGVVVAPGLPTSAAKPVVEATRSSTAQATRRRRRVLGLVLLANAVVATLAGFAVLAWAYAAVPAGLLVAWLVACRLMVKQERSVRSAPRRPLAAPAAPTESDQTEEISSVSTTPAPAPEPPPSRDVPDEGAWDPVPVTLPTYVTKPAAPARTVRTIDLDSTGVWTSGHNAADSALVREADAAERAATSTRGAEPERRASGS